MSRGIDGFEIDDFRGSDFGPDREVSRSPSSDWSKWTELHNIHREEERADRFDREGPDRSNRDRPPLAREERVQAILSQRTRTQYADRNKTYSLRDSEIHMLSEVGKFRVVTVRDLWSPLRTLTRSIETLMRISRTCAPTGLCSGSFRASNSSTFRP